MAQADWITYGNAGGAKAAQIARLRELFANIGAFTPSDYQEWEVQGDQGANVTKRGLSNANIDALFQQMGIRPQQVSYDFGNAVYEDVFAGDNGYQRVLRSQGDPTGVRYILPSMADPEREGKRGAYTLSFNADGSIADVAWQNYDLSKGFFGDNMSWLGPLLVGGAAFAGNALGGAAGGAAGGAGAAGGGYMGGLTAGAGGTTGLTAGAAGVTGITAPAGFTLAPGLGAGAAAGGAAGYMGGLNANASGVGLQMPSAPSLGSMGGAQGIVPASVAPMTAESLIPFGTQAATAPSLVQRALSAARTVSDYSALAGPAMSLLGGVQQMGSLPQQPADAPRLPGLEAPPEARGWQAGVAPIVDVLNRNRRAGKSLTQLTGSRGVNMSSTRARGNTLLGL